MLLPMFTHTGGITRKQVVTSPLGEIRPIEYQDAQAFQPVMAGDKLYVVKHTVGSALTNTQVLVWINENEYMSLSNTEIYALPLSLSNWLYATPVDANLPQWAEWDHTTLSCDLAKKDRLRRFFYFLDDTQLRDMWITKAMRAPGRVVPTMWQLAQEMPEHLCHSNLPKETTTIIGITERNEVYLYPYNYKSIIDTKPFAKAILITVTGNHITWNIYRNV